MEQSSNIESNVSTRKRPRWEMIAILFVAWLVLLMPFLFWKGTWFGNKLSDRQIAEYLSDRDNPRHSQHALVQISDRISQGDRSVNQFYPQVVRLVDSPVVELRTTSAWLMGQDNTYPPFHTALLRLLSDSEPLVRWNAALALIRFNDDHGRGILHEMLHPYALPSPATGTFKGRLKPGDAVNPGTLMARIVLPGKNDSVEIRSSVPGRIQVQLVPDGMAVSSGSLLFEIAPDEKEVWEALRGFYLIGTSDDLPDIQPFVHSKPDMSARIQEQARLTVEAIQQRKK